MKGTIVRIPKSESGLANFAFIKGEDEAEYFLHASGLINPWDELKDLVIRQRYANVEFEVVQSPRGPRANNATIIYVEGNT
jgi:cold shock CspA family protein